MSITYINHVARYAQSRRERRGFLARWWRIYAGDPRWVPPHYLTLRQALEPSHNPHLARMSPVFIQIEALPRHQRPAGGEPYQTMASSPGLAYERTVAATVALNDPRRGDNAAYLALVRCVNHSESIERLAEALWASGCRRLVGPTGLSTHLETGLLEDHWNQDPPLHTPYNPPYLPELIGNLMDRLESSRLYHLQIPRQVPPPPPAPAELLPMDPARLARDLLPLLDIACSVSGDFPPPDAEEASFLLRWLERWPLHGWLAQVEEQPAGFVLLQPDVGAWLRRSNGGRHLLWRPWLSWLGRRPTRQGRVIFGGVLPRWQGQGIGRQLLQQALVAGHHLGWQTLTIGPVRDNVPACAFLERHGAHPHQTYRLYQWEL